MRALFLLLLLPSLLIGTIRAPYRIVFLVDAPHLNLESTRNLLKSLAKHPRDWSKDGSVGHAWIYLIGEGQEAIEGGHSGELGIIQPKYFDGIMNLIEYGYINPTPLQKMNPQYEPNPIKYLWAIQEDGFFQKGNGGHHPSFAAMRALTANQYWAIRHLLNEYPWHHFALAGNQCCSFVVKVAALAGLSIDAREEICIERTLCLGGEKVQLWEDPKYGTLSLLTPDRLECALQCAVAEGKAEKALHWYRELPSSKKKGCVGCWLRLLPMRLWRAWLFC